jgi:hypothetical protein
MASIQNLLISASLKVSSAWVTLGQSQQVCSFLSAHSFQQSILLFIIKSNNKIKQLQYSLKKVYVKIYLKENIYESSPEIFVIMSYLKSSILERIS